MLQEVNRKSKSKTKPNTKYQRKVQSIYMQDVGVENIELLEKDTIED